MIVVRKDEVTVVTCRLGPRLTNVVATAETIGEAAGVLLFPEGAGVEDPGCDDWGCDDEDWLLCGEDDWRM